MALGCRWHLDLFAMIINGNSELREMGPAVGMWQMTVGHFMKKRALNLRFQAQTSATLQRMPSPVLGCFRKNKGTTTSRPRRPCGFVQGTITVVQLFCTRTHPPILYMWTLRWRWRLIYYVDNTTRRGEGQGTVDRTRAPQEGPRCI